MIRQKIEIRGLAEPGYERWIGPKTEGEKARSLAIMQRMDEEEKKHPGAEIRIEFRDNQFYLLIKTGADLILENCLKRSREIYQRQIVDRRTKLRKFFLY